MTVCIGALACDANNSPCRCVVVAADRMVTMGGLIEFEHEVPKISQITGQVVSLVAGDALRGSQLARGLASHFQAGAQSVEAVAKRASEQYAALRLAQVESEVLAPRGIKLMDFYGGMQHQIVQQLAFGIDQQINQFNYGVEFLIAGVDSTGGHIYAVNNPGGTFSDYEQIGYTATGSGGLQAMQSMIGFSHTGSHSLSDTVFAVYASKRRAESAPGVGNDTDLAIISNEGILRLTPEQLATLAELYRDYQTSITGDLRGRIAALRLVPERVVDEHAQDSTTI